MASSKEEWQKYQEAMRRGDKEAAAEAFKRYLEAKKIEGKGGSSPTIVRLKTGPGWHAVPVDKIPEQIIRDPQFFEDMKKLASKEK